MNRAIRNTGFYLIVFLVTVGIVQMLFNQDEPAEELYYNQILQAVEQNNIQSLTLQADNGSYLVTGEFRNPPPGQSKTFSGRVPYAEYIVQYLTEAGIEKDFKVTIKKMPGQSFWLTFLTSIIPFVIMFVLFFFLINQAQGGGGKVMNFGKSRARLYNEDKKKVT